MKKHKTVVFILSLCVVQFAVAQTNDTVKKLQTIKISSHRHSGVSRMGGAENGTVIGQGELFRAACCNLGESFEANPSVDVNYNDAATGARQIRLLGLSGRYVQMLVEGLPMPAGPATSYSLGYVPGAWMKNIAVSKGASSVKNGFQSVTGQIDVEYLKPEDEDNVSINIYGNSMGKGELNAMANIHLNEHLSTELLGHYERDFVHHDDDGDGWHDMPRMNQLNLSNRWKYASGRYIFHGGLGLLDESREGGQILGVAENPYRILIGTRRYDAYMKHALLLNAEHNTNIAFLANATSHETNARFGMDSIEMCMRSLNAQLVLEHEFNDAHSLSAGLSLQADGYADSILLLQGSRHTDIIPGVYAQYTYNPSHRFTAMAGLRGDHSSRHGAFVTPRLHLKWMTTDWLTLRASSGLGYRTPYALAEYHYLLASGRSLVVGDDLQMEKAWNNGVSAALYFPVGGRTLKVNAEYYYTHFFQQLVVDYDSDPSLITLTNLEGRSFSSTLQLDVSYAFSSDFDATAAFRMNDVRCTYGGQLLEAPLTSRYKGLFTASWKPLMGLWKIDATLQLNGPGRMPTPYTLADGSASWDEEFPAYLQLGMQVTREFRHFSVYVGGENLTNYRQPNPVINAANPWSADFEPTMVWGPVNGVVVYAGLRYNLKNNNN